MQCHALPPLLSVTNDVLVFLSEDLLVQYDTKKAIQLLALAFSNTPNETRSRTNGKAEHKKIKSDSVSNQKKEIINLELAASTRARF